MHVSKVNEQGLTLVEAVVSILIFFAASAGIIPVFLNYTLTTINNERRTSAIAVSQQVLDGLRQVDPLTLPASGTETLPDVSYQGKVFTPTVTYCQNADFCTNPDSRHILLQVSQNGTQIYQAETVFTNFR